MAQNDLLKRYLDAGVTFTHLTQARAEAIVRDLVRAGEVQTGDARQRVEELLERSRKNSDNLMKLVRDEVNSQVARLGLVPKKELDAVRKELADLRAAKATTAKKAKKAAPAAKRAAAPARKATGAAKKS